MQAYSDSTMQIGQRFAYWREGRHEIVTLVELHAMGTLDHVTVRRADGSTAVCPARFLRPFALGMADARGGE